MTSAVDDARRLRFEREIDLVAGLRHPRIVSVYDCGSTDDDAPYFVMEYIDGAPLDEYIAARDGTESESHGPPALEQRLGLFAKTCDAVSHAHQHGIIHRDLKPANILVDAEGEPRVVDFGVARPVISDDSSAGLTSDGGFVGTLRYAAPEQVQGASPADVRSDVYALGVILYELITRQSPYATDGSLAETVRAITQEKPLPPGQVLRRNRAAQDRRRWSGELDAIALKALAKQPDRRYQSADALKRDVERYLAGDAVEAKRDNTGYVLRKLLARHRLVAALVAALLISIGGFGAAMGLMYKRAQAEADKANQIRAFLEDTLASVSPTEPGRDVTLRNVLDDAVLWIDRALAERPEVAASIRATIGNSYRALGDLDAAEPQIEASLALRRELFGDEHAEFAHSLSLLGLLRQDQGDYEQAEKLLRDGLEMRRRALGDAAPQVTYSLHNLGRLNQAMGRMDDAEAALREALELRRAAVGEHHQDTAMSEYLLAELLRQRGKLEEANELHRAALNTRRELLPADHPDLLRSLETAGE
jgi:serine/threonine-protein kinase